MSNFKDLDISANLKKSLDLMKFSVPTEIQEKSIPIVMSGKDTIIRSKTGSGKTAAYMIPILNQIEQKHESGIKALIVLPTRELALQTHRVANRLGKLSKIKSTIVYGGASISKQVESLPGTDIVIGTPGRIIDLVNQGYIKLSTAKYLVLDEADMMFDMGFIDDIKKIIKFTPDDRQIVLLSATLPPEIKKIAIKFMKDPTFVSAGGEEAIPESIKHLYVMSSKFDKFSTLMSYLHKNNSKKSIIFVKTQRSGDLLNLILTRAGFFNIVIHGGMKQYSREKAIINFKQADTGILVATNVAARGLDIPNITDIINFDAPETSETYAHRVGRSGRMGKNGRALTMFADDQKNLLRIIQKGNDITMEKIDVDVDAEYRDINYSKLILEFRNMENSEDKFDRPQRNGDSRRGRSTGEGSRKGRSSEGSRRTYSHSRGNDRENSGDSRRFEHHSHNSTRSRTNTR
ncbi:MAG: DEAD/DEAH box helicase [Ferroplasma sp.]